MVDCRWKVNRLIAHVDYKIKKASKLHGFKPLQRWKDGTTYVTSFFFYDRIGFLYQYVDGRFSVAYEDHTYDITDKYLRRVMIMTFMTQYKNILKKRGSYERK